ncbi:MAG: mucoidy inhibitor MuiA [Candidatus Caldatribacteriota bacterium]
MKLNIKRIMQISSFLLWMTLILMGTIIVEAKELEVDSKISKVCVYTSLALVDRKTHLELEKGNYQIVFPDIVPEIDEASLRTSVEGTAAIKLFGAQMKKEYLEEVPSERIKNLNQEIQILEDQVVNLENIKSILEEKREFLNSITSFSQSQIPQDLITHMPQVDDLKSILDFLDIELRNNYQQYVDAEIQIRDLKKKLEVLKNELSQISGIQRKLKRSIVVDMEVLEKGSLDLVVSYLVKGASWNPLYDARANFEKSEIELVYYGVIKQISGEDWIEVDGTLSTAKPIIGGNMPEITPWFIRPYQPLRVEDKVYGAPAPAFQETLKKEMEVSMELTEPEIEYASPEEKGVAVVYNLPYKITVKSDKSENKFPLYSQTLSAEFEYSTYPRISPFAYLGSKVTNQKDLQLLAGRINIFLEGDFVGSSRIDNIAPGEEFTLYLGIDENVKVKREILEKKVDETLIGNIASRTKKTTFRYKLSVENYKSRKIKVNLFEAMPVSEDDRIKIKIEEPSIKPNVQDWEDKKGIWLWQLEVESQQKMEIFYTFTIEHPRDMQIEGF